MVRKVDRESLKARTQKLSTTMCPEGNQEFTESCTVPVHVPPIYKHEENKEEKSKRGKTREEQPKKNRNTSVSGGKRSEEAGWLWVWV